MKQYKNSLLDYKTFVNLAPHMKEGYLGMADCYCQMNQINNAIEYYNKSIELDQIMKKATLIVQ